MHLRKSKFLGSLFLLCCGMSGTVNAELPRQPPIAPTSNQECQAFANTSYSVLKQQKQQITRSWLQCDRQRPSNVPMLSHYQQCRATWKPQSDEAQASIMQMFRARNACFARVKSHLARSKRDHSSSSRMMAVVQDEVSKRIQSRLQVLARREIVQVASGQSAAVNSVFTIYAKVRSANFVYSGFFGEGKDILDQSYFGLKQSRSRLGPVNPLSALSVDIAASLTRRLHREATMELERLTSQIRLEETRRDYRESLDASAGRLNARASRFRGTDAPADDSLARALTEAREEAIASHFAAFDGRGEASTVAMARAAEARRAREAAAAKRAKQIARQQAYARQQAAARAQAQRQRAYNNQTTDPTYQAPSYNAPSLVDTLNATIMMGNQILQQKRQQRSFGVDPCGGGNQISEACYSRYKQ